ncbi:MAG: aspartate carbamoyltransferase [Thermodesulfobacteriota bacteirum]|jgi:aspartate carbamoyltransferase|nr:aspartate carbamoyltransferase [Thermodesulfobacteriota bacterium]
MLHILSVNDLTDDFLYSLWSDASKRKGKSNNSLKGKVLTNLFYEPSTRTSSSFYSAMSTCGGSVIPINNVQFSSVAKGESFEDTVMTMSAMSDAIVVRHPDNGAAETAAKVSSVPIINAGDGNSEHPTQTIIDGFTIYNFFNKKLTNLRVTLVGDLKNGRTVKSLVKLLNRFENNHFNLVSPKDLSLSSDLPESYYETSDINEVLKETDILYVTRVQKERGSVHDYSLTLKQLESLPENSIVMHPFPRVSEIPVEFDIDKRAKYFDQIRYGVWCRQILLERVMK